MAIFSRRLLAVTIAVSCFAALPVRADDEADAKLFKKVMDRLLKSDMFIREYPDKFVFPPKAFIKPDSSKEVNAYASAHKVHGAELDEKTGKIRPVVMVTQGLMDQVIKGDEKSLAVIMGHELAHITKNHVVNRPKGETAVVILAFGREQEIEADLNGMRFAISAGYPYRKGVAKSFKEMRDKIKYSSFEGLSTTHPSWEDRLIFLDRDQAKLWTAMSAFQNGHAFLELEQYASAQQCFKGVTAEFPDCYEAWANLGYARLMQYCDGLDHDDVNRYGIGQIVTGGFYVRPDSLEAKVRGIDEKLWGDAVKALEKSLSLKADLVLPRASLGIAFLLHPEGKNVKMARKWFAEAIDHLAKDPELKRNPLSMAALLVNSGVADLAAGDAVEADKKFRSATDIVHTQRFTATVRSMESAIVFNRALVMGNSKEADAKERARRLLETYLEFNAPDTAWWEIAYGKYAKLGKELDVKVRTRISFFRKAAPQELRVITSVSLGKEVVSLSDPIDAAVRLLTTEEVEPTPLFEDAKIMRWRFVDHGIDLLAKDKVLAIFLTSKRAPSIKLRPVGLASEGEDLKIGMSEESARTILKDQLCDRGQRGVADAGTTYHSYPLLGLAVRYADGRLAEIAIAQMPRRVYGEKVDEK